MTRTRFMAAAVITIAAMLGSAPAGQGAYAQMAPVFIEPGHWSYEAIRKLAVMGVAPDAGDPALAPVTLQHARMVFDSAAAVASRLNRPAASRLAGGYAALLEAESGGIGLLAHAAADFGWSVSADEALAGDGYFPEEDWEGARILSTGHGPVAAISAHGWMAPWLSWRLRGGLHGPEHGVRVATLGLAAGPVDLWAGRRRLHYAVGRGGGTVLGTGLGESSDQMFRTGDAFDGIGIHVREPFRLPWILRVLGPVRIEAVAGRLERNGNVESPYVVFGRLIGMPFSRRITLGINRGAIFGGGGNPVTARRLAGLIFGMHGGDAGEFENQVFSVLARLRPPLDALPLEVYAEVGMDDTAGAISDAPAVVAGVDLGVVPGVPAAAVSIEHTQFARSCCGNPIWYRNIFFRGSWADEGQLFAHPLGGHGREWRLHARLDLPDTGLLASGDAYTRYRGQENLFAPERQGTSRGGSFRIEYRPAAAWRVIGEIGIETAQEWDMHRAALKISHTLTNGNQ